MRRPLGAVDMEMRPRLSLFALILACLGLGASLASLVDYISTDPTFCSASGCATVRESAWSHPLGIPMPLFGIAYFSTMLVLAFAARPKFRLPLALVGGLGAVGLVAVQGLVIGAWCKLCLVSDLSAIALALVVLAGATTLEFSAARAVMLVPAIALLPVGFAIASMGDAPAELVATTTTKPATPAVIAQAAADAHGTVPIVEFVDFECPFCRRLAPVLASAVQAAPSQVTVIRKMVPLSMHKHARTAALAWCCADAQGKGDAMAQALFDAPADELTPEGCERLAVAAGCDLERYRQALADPATAQRIDADTADAQAAGATALPDDLRRRSALHGRKSQRGRLARRDREHARELNAASAVSGTHRYVASLRGVGVARRV